MGKKTVVLLLSLCLSVSLLAMPAAAVTKDKSGSIWCGSNAAAVTGYGSGYITLRAPGAVTTWTSKYHYFNSREHATVFKHGSWAAWGSKYLDTGTHGTYAYCR